MQLIHKHTKKKKKKFCHLTGFNFSHQKQLAVLVSHTHCEGVRLAFPQTGGRTLQSDEVLSPAPAPHMHTVPYFRLEPTRTHTHTHTMTKPELKAKRTNDTKITYGSAFQR